MLDPVLDRFLGIQEWGHHISPVRFNKLITGTEFAEYLRSTKGITGVKPFKQAWGKVTWKEREDSREEFVGELLRRNKKMEHTRLLEMGRENYIASIVNAHRIHYEAKAPEREQRIAQACASYAARNPELMEEIYNSDDDASSG